VVEGAVCCRKDVGSVVLRQGGIEFEDTWSQISHLSVKSHSGIAPDPSFLPKQVPTR
jgi:hypothetical protein